MDKKMTIGECHRQAAKELGFSDEEYDKRSKFATAMTPEIKAIFAREVEGEVAKGFVLHFKKLLTGQVPEPGEYKTNRNN